MTKRANIVFLMCDQPQATQQPLQTSRTPHGPEGYPATPGIGALAPLARDWVSSSTTV